jgi:hypothetical protein
MSNNCYKYIQVVLITNRYDILHNLQPDHEPCINTQQKQTGTHYSLHSGKCPFTCNVCNKEIADPRTLKRHQRIHSNAW